ncbi:hypothetical protein D7V80_23170 [Corallococcus sp. CA054B]|uniref:phospholipase D-like domain-containing protein n=1 Tax=Corallococcus sp. CA054B TaxID=2316734 RepID=UPI000EA1EC6E|nr:phospholipase D-like domain-containing protein [Corallococcus sp. CA054B]RKG65497.1 hypothetical protein D7V80_23170 [Corallococcus sp. CA054B]
MSFEAFPVSGGTLLHDGDYAPFAASLFAQARKRLWVSVFIIDTRVLRDPLRSVRGLVEQLSLARWRNVDVRVLVGVSDTPEVHIANTTSALYMRELGLPVRLFHSERHVSTHSKFVIVDDQVLLGSHNWTHSAFHVSHEDSLAVSSPQLAMGLGRDFERLWIEGARNVEVAHAS